MRRGAAVAATGMVLVLIGACTLAPVDFNGVRGEGPLVTEARAVSSFDAINIGGGIHVRLSIGATQSVSLEAEQNILEILDTIVEDGTLSIDNRDNYSTSRGVTLTIVVPELVSVTLSGGADGRLAGIDADRLQVEVSGGAELDAAGQVSALELTASGGAKAYLDDLAAASVTLDASGGARVEVNATERISGEASGGATVRTDGDAVVDVSSSGGATVD